MNISHVRCAAEKLNPIHAAGRQMMVKECTARTVGLKGKAVAVAINYLSQNNTAHLLWSLAALAYLSQAARHINI